MANKKQIWLIGTDMNGRTKYGAPNTVMDFDLVTEIGTYLNPGSRHVLFCFCKKGNMVGAAAYIHASEPWVNRRGSYAGVAIEFPRDQIPNPESIFTCFNQVIKLYQERLEQGTNDVLTFKKSLAETFADWEKIVPSFHDKLESKFPILCQAVSERKSPAMVLLPTPQLVSACFIAFLQQNVYEEIYLTADGDFECFKTHLNLDINTLLLHGVLYGNQYMHNEMNKLRQELNEARETLNNLKNTYDGEREKWRHKESQFSTSMREDRKKIDSLTQENDNLKKQGSKLVEQGKKIDSKLQHNCVMAQESIELFQKYRKSYSFLLRNS